MDIEAAFLEGKLQKKYYLEPPDMLVQLGFMTAEEFKTHCIELQNGMYGQVDAARRFFVRFVGYLVGENCNGIVQNQKQILVYFIKRIRTDSQLWPLQSQ